MISSHEDLARASALYQERTNLAYFWKVPDREDACFQSRFT
jgi:hypothetical protein